jgi:hypothetical protein
VGVPCQPKEELAKVPALLAKLRDQASKAGGPAPAPEAPKLTVIEAIEAQTGNAQLLELFTRHDESSGAVQGLDQDCRGHRQAAAGLAQAERPAAPRQGPGPLRR